jgi:hypothetical protein
MGLYGFLVLEFRTTLSDKLLSAIFWWYFLVKNIIKNKVLRFGVDIRITEIKIVERQIVVNQVVKPKTENFSAKTDSTKSGPEDELAGKLLGAQLALEVVELVVEHPLVPLQLGEPKSDLTNDKEGHVFFKGDQWIRSPFFWLQDAAQRVLRIRVIVSPTLSLVLAYSYTLYLYLEP